MRIQILILVVVVLISSACRDFLFSDLDKLDNPEIGIPIRTCQDLANIGSTPENLTKTYIQLNDIDCSSINPFTPLGNSINRFSGIYDGKNHTVSNVTINIGAADGAGIFAYIHADGLVKNLRLTNIAVTANDNVGALAGNCDGTIKNITAAKITINANDNVGGLVGSGSGATVAYCTVADLDITAQNSAGGVVGDVIDTGISNCTVSGDVSGSDRVGGIAGKINCNNGTCTVTRSSSSCTVNGHQYVGGLVGYNISYLIQFCYTTGFVTTDYVWAGGLVGFHWGTVDMNAVIDQCYSTAAVVGDRFVGGLVAYNYLQYSIIKNSYAKGSVTELTGSTWGYHLGALVGDHEGTVINSYAVGLVTSSDSKIGFTGVDDGTGTYSNCFYDIDTTGLTWDVGDDNGGTSWNDPNISGTSTANMKLEGTFSGWNFDTIWGISPGINNGYPYLRAMQ